MAEKNISAEQMVRLQTLYHKVTAGDPVPAADPRLARLEWASSQLGRTVESFRDLTSAEASKLIDVCQTAIGQPNLSPPRRPSKPRTPGYSGTEGRKGYHPNGVTLVRAADLERIQTQLKRLGWDQTRLDTFLRSSTSPLHGRTQIRTEGDANKVYWALKRMASRAAV